MAMPWAMRWVLHILSSQTFEDLLKAAPGMGARNAELYILLDNTFFHFHNSILLKFRPTLAI